MSETIPSVSTLKAFRTVETEEGRLISPLLDESVDKHAKDERDGWTQFLATEAGSMEEERLAKTLAKIYELKNAQKLSSPEAYLRSPDRELWAMRFTEASAEIFGAPERPFIRRIVVEQSRDFETHSGSYVDGVKSFYADLNERLSETEVADEESLRPLDEESASRLAEAFLDRNHDWFEYLKQHRQESYTPLDLQALFTQLIDVRAQTDPRWEGWTVEMVEGKSSMSTSSKSKKIYVGADRVVASYQDVTRLVAHELGVHAERSINGLEKEEMLSTGYPDYLDAEESLGMLAERFVTGETSDKAQDRYLDIALAMGLIPGIQLSRTELASLFRDRALARRQIQGEEITEDIIALETTNAKNHTGRIFRGGDGLSGEHQAVFTKDSVYYPAALEDYLVGELSKGKSPREILDFILQGKFDPTDPRHVARLESLEKTKQDA